ncbi:MAG: serine acetyltransferase [Pseudomonadota bacterium]
MPAAPDPLSFAETRRRMRGDCQALRQCLRARGLPDGALFWSPACQCVMLYRLSRHCHVRGWNLRARFFWQLNLWLTGADISPMSDLGEALLVIHPVAVTISGSAGRGLVVEGWGGMGGGLDMADIGAGPGLPVLGDDVVLDHGAMVLGPVRVGHRVHIGAGCTVTRDIPDDSIVEEPPVRVRLPGQH